MEKSYYPFLMRPTVFPALNFNAKADAQALYDAMKGFGYDGKTLISIVCNRSCAQRIEISDAYKLLFGRDIKADFRSELNGNMKNTILALMTPLPLFFAQELHDALYGPGTAEAVLIEILSTLSNSGVKCIAAAYEQAYGKPLEIDLVEDTSGNFRKLCVSLVQGRRDENTHVDDKLAVSDAQRLFDAGVARWGTDESVFNMILASRSYHHLRKVFVEYFNLAGHTIDDAIEAEFSGDIKMGHLAIVKCVRNKSQYLAERLHKSMKGLGTDDKTLIRIVVSRSEIDLGTIKSSFQELYGDSLEEWIKDDTTGDYRKALLAIVSEEQLIQD